MKFNTLQLAEKLNKLVQFTALCVLSCTSVGSTAYASPYAYMSNYPTHQHSAAIGLQTQRLTNGPTSVYTSDASSLYQTCSNSASINGLYGGAAQRSSLSTQPLVGVSALTNWAAMPSAFTSIPTTSTVSLQQSRLGSSTGPLHSPLTAQAYSVGSMGTDSGQSALDVNDGSYTLSQASPEHMLPECASTEPSKFISTLLHCILHNACTYCVLSCHSHGPYLCLALVSPKVLV